jgi:hypothetical protein
MATTQKPEALRSRREFIKKTAAGAAFAAGFGPGIALNAWPEENEAVNGIDAKKLAAIKPEDLQQVTFASLARYPCLEPIKSSQDHEKKKWAEIMSAVFPEGLERLKGMGWVKHNESKGNYAFATEAPKLRLATAHLFAIRRTPVGGNKNGVRLYCEFIANAPLEEVNQTGNPYGNSPPVLFDAFFNSGGHTEFIRGGEKSMDAQARAWEKDNGIKLKGGSTLAGVSIILTPQPPELSSPDVGGVRLSLIRREAMAAQIVAHGKGVVDVAMMKAAVRAKSTKENAEQSGWQREFYKNLKTDLKDDPKLSARMEALDAMAANKVVPEEALLEVVLDLVSESLTAKAYSEDMKFLNRVNYLKLFLESSLASRSDAAYPGYQVEPRTKTTSARNAILAVKGTVVAKALIDTDNETRYRQLSASFIEESEGKPERLSDLEELFQGIFALFGPRRAEFLQTLKKRQGALETDRMVQQVERERESYLSNMAPLRRVEFVDSAYDGLLGLKKALNEK